jgi:hypothetical protein
MAKAGSVAGIWWAVNCVQAAIYVRRKEISAGFQPDFLLWLGRPGTVGDTEAVRVVLSLAGLSARSA